MAAPAAPTVPLERAVWRWGLALLALALAVGLALAFALMAVAQAYVWVLPAAIVAGGVVWALSRVPMGQLCGVLAFYAAAASQTEGIQVEEVVFAAYYLGFLAHWFAVHVWLRRERVVRSALDAVFVLLPLWATASLAMTALYGGPFGGALSDWINFSMLLFFFPVREAVERYRIGPWVVVSLALFIGAVAVVRNVFILQSAFSNAEYAWEIARGRAPMNELLMLVPALGCLTFAMRARRLTPWVLYAAGFGFFTLGVILTQWRSAYLDIAAGIGLLLLLGSWRERGRLALLLLLGAAAGGLLAYLLFRDLFTLLFLGILDRILSIGTATETDISLLNRFIEWERVWALIRANPIVGYGLGTEFGFYDAIFRGTWVKSFIHNGFLLLWFKLGLVGLGAIAYAWGRGTWEAFRAARMRALPFDERTLGLACGVVLLSLIPSTLVSTTFTTSDAQLVFTLLIGVAAGLAPRLRRPARQPDE
ncbi:MAG: O-antigen ligase family protein [Rubricoccaceae bacterium]|nr:O-antigen ligase family protein [Rubricoccaceae bacterium]